MLAFLIDNIYIRVGKEIFRQQVGIPMGTDCAPFLANLFLFYFEYNYMKDLIKSNIHLAKQFSYTTRYICLPVNVRLGLTRNVTIRRARH